MRKVIRRENKKKQTNKKVKLHVLIMSRTRFRVNPHSIAA